MFRNTRDGDHNILSTSGTDHGGGGGSIHGAAWTSKPAISKSFIATIFWALLSLGLMAAGWTYSGSRRLESSAMKCDMRGCKLVESTDGVSKVLTIPRMKIKRGELVRVKNGAIVDPSKMRRSAQRKLGHTYAVVYTETDPEYDDDDESYDSFEDDDDGPAWDAGTPGQRPNAPPAKKPTVTSVSSSKSNPEPPSEEEKKAAADRRQAVRKAAYEKKAADRARYAEAQRSMVKEPVREPDEQKARLAYASRPVRREAAQHPTDDNDVYDREYRFPVRREAAQRPMYDDDYDREDRFPGDAGTMQEKNRDEIAQMEAAQGMAMRDHRERSQKAYEEASRKNLDKHKFDRGQRQMGNKHHVGKIFSPDDRNYRQAPPNFLGCPSPVPVISVSIPCPRFLGLPSPEPFFLLIRRPLTPFCWCCASPYRRRVEQKEDERPKLERGESPKDLSGAKDGIEEGAVDAAVDPAAGTAAGTEEEMKNLQDRLVQLKKEAEMKKAIRVGRTISLGGLESVEADHLSGKDEARREGLPADGEAGALEGGRDYETLGEFVPAGAAGARRKLLTWKNRVKNVETPAARRTREEIESTVDYEVGAKVAEKGARHHHKAFHHNKEVPAEQRHHVHPGFHHEAGEKKIDHGSKHQSWHIKGELKKLATSYSLGRSKSRERKKAIDSYVSRRSHKVDFVDSNKWSAMGPYMMMIVGFISASFCLIFGNFRPKFSRRQTGVSSLEESLLTPEDRVEK